MDQSLMLLKLAVTTLWTLALTLVGFILASVIIEYRVIDRFSYRMVKLARLTNVHPVALAAALGYVAGPKVAHGALSRMLSEGRIREGDVLSSILMACFLCRVYVAFRWFLPVVLPLLGPELALKLLSINLAVDLALTITGVLYAKLLLRPPALSHGTIPDRKSPETKPSLGSAVRAGLRGFARFAYKYLALSAAVAAFILLGGFDALSAVLRPYVARLGLSPAAAVVTATYLIRPSAALIVCSSMLASGELAPSEALPAVLLGSSLFMLLNDGAKNILPYYLSVYPRGLSVKLFLARVAVPSAIYGALAVVLTRCLLP